jgi:hypothetical protein
MRKFLGIALLFLLLGLPAFAQKPSHTGLSSGGGHHTTSHGGKYRGSTNSHHKGSHYPDLRTGNKYGHHKPS